ncbi:MAG: YCF48-related protein [Spirosomataceae bacterium]
MKLLPQLFFFLIISFVTFSQWAPQNSGTDAHFRSVSAVNERVVWAGGSKGTVLRTTDGGSNWVVIKVLGAEKLDFRGIKGIDPNTAVAVSAGLAEEGQARIYRTEDAGKTWQQVWQTNQKGVFLDGVAFWDKKNGMIFGDPLDNRMYLLKTSDGGKSWERLLPAGLPENLPKEASFAASNSTMVVQGSKHIWVGTGGADRARVFYSVDRGQTWQVSDTPMKANASSGIFGLHFWDVNHGIAVGGDYKADREAFENVITTQDGGKTWQNAAPTDPAGLKEAVVKRKDGTLIAAGPAGSCISTDNGKTWQPLTGASAGLHALTVSGNRCWAIGSKGQIVRLSD